MSSPLCTKDSLFVANFSQGPVRYTRLTTVKVLAYPRGMTRAQEDVCADCESHPEVVETVRDKLRDSRTHTRLADFFKNLADPTRVRLLDALSHSELCVHDIADLLGMSQSAVSHQLRILRQNHLVKFRKDGKHVFYQLDDDHVSTVLNTGLAHIGHET